MPFDLMAGLLEGGAGNSFPAVHSPQNPYSWLDDPPEHDSYGTSHSYKSASLIPSSRKATSPPSIIDLPNDNGKRCLENHAITACDEPDQKRMRVVQVYSERPTSGLDRTPDRQRFLRSPPPMHNSAHAHAQHQRSSDSLSSANVSKQMYAYRSDHSETAQGSSNNSRPSSNRSVSMRPTQDDFNGPSSVWQEPSPPRIKRQSHCDWNRSTHTREPATRGPFNIDDDDDDSSDNERASKPIQKIRTLSMSPTPMAERKELQPRSQITTSQRERQLLESRRRRQEAAQRRREKPHPSRGTRDEVRAEEHRDDEMEMECLFLSADRSGVKDSRIKKDDSNLFRSCTKHRSPAKDSVVDLTGDYRTDLDISARPDEKTQRALGQGPIRKLRHADEEYRPGKEVLEASQKNAELHARVSALDEEDKEHADARRAVEARKEVESNETQRARSRMQEEYDRQVSAQGEMARRSRARIEAQNSLEAQQEAEAEQKEQEKRQAEQRDWDEKERIKDEHRETLRKQQAEVDQDQRRLDDQQSALARLNAVCPLQLPPKAIPQNEQKSETDINDIVSKHTTPAGLHFKGDSGSTAADGARARVKEIQDRNAQRGLLQAKPSSVSEFSRREERIRAMEERNKRLREAEAAADEDEDGDLRRNDQSQTPKHPTSQGHETDKRDSRVPTPALTPPALPKGPQALSSAAGQALLAQTNAKQSRDRSGTAFTEKRKSHDRQLGVILPEDIRLVKWRDDGIQFKEIAVLWDKEFSTSRSPATLHKRYRQVKEALRSAGVGQDLLGLVASGSADALEEVNRAVHGRWPLSEAPKIQRNAKGHFIAEHERSESRERGGTRGAATVSRGGLLSPNLTSSFASSTSEATIAADENPGPRPHVGGKKLNDQAYLHFLEHLREVDAEDEPATTPREQSPICYDNYYHFAYQVQRREISQEDLDDGFVINEDDPWQVCDEPLDNLSKANIKAAKEAACLPKKWKYEGDSDVEFEISSRNLKDGKKMFRAFWHGIGEVQVRVARYTRYQQDNVRPTSKDGWAPKTIYFVRERKVEKTGDDVFSESKETDVTKSVENAVYTTLEEANAVAIKHFVYIAFESRSANLTQRDIEVNEMVKRLESELAQEGTYEGEDGGQEEKACFRKEIEGEDGRRRLEVWVEEGRLKGPRNL